MPKIAKELSAVEVRNLTKPGRHSVGGVSGLLIQVTPSGAKSWLLRVMVGNQRREMGLGGFPDVTLAQAREKARELKEQVQKGIDPVAQKKSHKASLIAAQSKLITFDEAARKFLSFKTAEFKSQKHAAQWSSTLSAYASPVIGKLNVADVELSHIVKILEPIWTTKTETASRLRGRIESVLAWAKVSGYREGDNPASWKGNLDAVFPKPGKLKNIQHHKALPWEEIPSFTTLLKNKEGISARALEFLILTACRSSEARGAVWSEIDLKKGIWTIPADRMKAGKEHSVPLSKRATEILDEIPRIEGSEFIFPGMRGGMISDVALAKTLKSIRSDVTTHGFRSTFRDWCAECTDYPHEVAEMALAHTIPNAVERAYRRGDLLEKRRHLMRDWERYSYK